MVENILHQVVNKLLDEAAKNVAEEPLSGDDCPPNTNVLDDVTIVAANTDDAADLTKVDGVAASQLAEKYFGSPAVGNEVGVDELPTEHVLQQSIVDEALKELPAAQAVQLPEALHIKLPATHVE